MRRNVFQQYRNLPKEIYIIFFSRIINSLGSFVHPLLSLILTSKIGLNKDETGIYITLFSVLTVPSLILGGKLVDSIGRKAVIVGSQGIGAAVLIAAGFMEPSMTLVYLLIVSALFFAAAMPAYDALLADITTPDNRKASYSLVYMGWNIGFAIGPMMAGFLFKSYLPLVFIIDGMTTLLSLALVAAFVKETRHELKVEQQLTLEQKVEGSIFRVLWQRPIILAFAAISFCFQFEYAQWSFAMPLHLKELFAEQGPVYYGILASLNGIIVIAATPLLAKWTERMNVFRVMALGGTCYALAFGMLGFIQLLPAFFVSIVVLTLGEILILINASTFIANYTPASHRGRMSTVVPLLSGAGYALSPMIMGFVITGYSLETGWLVIGGIGIISTLLMERLYRVTSRR